MGHDIAEALVKALNSQDTRGNEASDTQLVQLALDRYSPANMSELYMAVRAACADAPSGLVEVLCVVADRDPGRTLEEFLQTLPDSGK